MSVPAIAIRDRVMACILAAGVPGLDEVGKNILPREQAEHRATDPDPSCVVVLGDEYPVAQSPRTNSTVSYEYPVLVVLKSPTALRQATVNVALKEARHAIRGVLQRHLLLGATGIVCRCRYDPRPTFGVIGFKEGIKVTGQLFVYRTVENRTA